MTRRVIFPDPDIWTQPKERTMTDPTEPTAADARRAAALTMHHRRGNTNGVLAIADEVNETRRGTELVLALLDLHASALIQIRTPHGIDLIGRHVQELAAAHELPEADNPIGQDICRAAALLDSHGRTDIDGMEDVILDALEAGRPTQLILGLLDLYESLMPELTSAAGVDWLTRCINDYANEEAKGE